MNDVIRAWQSQMYRPYLHIATCSLKIISIFDDLRYDRADVDMLSPGMRKHLVQKLETIGFKQKSGSVLTHKTEDIRCLIPKSHALGASPFHITRQNGIKIITP